MIVAGLDLSPSSSALVLIEGERVRSFEHLAEEGTKGDLLARFRMAERVLKKLSEWMPDLVALEDYDLGLNGQYVPYDIAEIGGLVRFYLIQKGFPLCLINPRKLKSYVLHQKKVEKSDVIDFAERNGFLLPIKKRGSPGLYKRQREDLADAFVLSKMGTQVHMYVAEGVPSKKGDIFLDPETGLVFRSDLLYNADKIGV